MQSWMMYAIAGGLVVLLLLLLVVRGRQKATADGSKKTASKSKHTSKQASSRSLSAVDKTARYQELMQMAGANQQAPTSPQAPQAMLASQPIAVQPVAVYAGAVQHATVSAAPVGDAPVQHAAPAPAPSRVGAPAPGLNAVPFEQYLPGSDPLQTLIIEILEGWGDVTEQDTNRLTVFRSERVAATISRTELPKELKGSDQARARLSQLRRWAGSLEQKAPPAPAATMGVGAAMVGQMQPVAPQAPAMPPVTLQTPVAAPMASAVVIETPLAQVVQQPIDWDPSVAPTAPQPPMQQQTPAMPDTGVNELIAATKSTEAAIAAAAAAFWARPELADKVPGALDDDPTATSEAPPTPAAAYAAAAAAQAVPQPGQIPTLGQQLPGLNVVTPAIEAPAVPFVMQPDWRETSGAMESDTFMEDLRSSQVTTAERLLTLPSADQPGMLAFLKPSELAKVLKTTGDVQLKRAVIDQLESIGSTTALDVIYRALDDPFPEIRAKALEAADRVLGAE